VLFILLCAFLFPRAGRLAGSLLPETAGRYLELLVTYGLPLLITLMVMLMLSRSISLRDIGFNLNHGLWSLKVSFISVPVVSAAALLWVYLSRIPYHADTAPSLVMLLVQPLSQEILYRALIIGVLHPVFSQMRPLFGKGISSAGLISALVFALSTVTISLNPVSVQLVNPMLQLLMLGFGIWYAVMFEYTHSLLGPVMTHAFFQGALMLCSYLILT
jgi:membrane protease YdiL (CAAX protease family)